MLLEESELSGDFLVLIVHILSKVSKSTFARTKVHIYENVFTNSTYIRQLKQFIAGSPYHDQREMRNNKYFWKDTDKFWYNLEDIFLDMTTIPTLASQVLPKLLESIVITLPILESQQNIHISEDIKDKFKVLQEKMKKIESDMKEKYHSKEPQPHHETVNEDGWIPPNDFRTINVYPDILEVAMRQEPFLRKNKTLGPYQNIDHYLDVQFRLLREDFIAPLRRGICQYLEKPTMKRYDDVKIHPKVHFLSEENVNELKCFKIRFDFSQKKKSLKYEQSKEFMFGSLVCFSNDRFVSIIFAKIVQRDPVMIKNGELIVGLDGDENAAISYNSDYIMVESKVYFEPYFHVLTALQNITENNFPLERYLVHAESDVDYPEYIDHSTTFTIDRRTINPTFWQNRQYQFYGLNESQEEALKASLTNEISIIQGPPGTGKTFLGLKIAHTLLQNKHCWYKKTPLLVICFTNHALDQFLEGILGSTRNLLRIGGQSKNAVLQNYNLRNKKKKKSQAFYQARRELTISLNDLKAFDKVIDRIRKYDSVLDFSCFREVVMDMEGTWFYTAGAEDIKQWLFQNADTSTAVPALHNNPISYWHESDSFSDDEMSDYGEDYAELEEVDEIFTNIRMPKDGGTNEGVKQTHTVKTLINLQSLLSKIQDKERDLDDPVKVTMHGAQMKSDLRLLRNEYGYWKQNLDQLKKGTGFSRYILRKYPFEMKMNERWALYHHFLKDFLHQLLEERKEINNLYQEKYKLYTEQRDMEDVTTMRESLIIGMTTTSAARLRPVVQALRSPIVIVEEAAEVLEAHILSALTVHCQQLILIGDHQQLRPKPADYTVETKYQMGVSLFERMIRNDIQCHTLNVQHRMRPEICNLIRPSIYSDLKDHQSVSERPEISGVDKPLFFITHDKREESCGDSSKKNLHEVKFLINLAKYLILNGYQPQDITILAAYLGQMFELQREKKKYSLLLRDVRISVLDNYQGEESDIILLSLVRNNEGNNNGFLKDKNRVCVALSRARNGLYIMGNMSQLCKDKSSIWPTIKETLEKQNAIGTSLELRCQVHNVITKVKSDADFSGIPEGGCTRHCGAELSCGHICVNICHLTDRDHLNYICIKTCGRKLCTRSEKHLCDKPCYQQCAPCHYPCRWKLRCGHEVTLQCHVDPEQYACVTLVDTLLPCGHTESKPCHVKPEDFPCPEPCDALLDCGHACTLSCHDRRDPDHLNYKCPKPCGKLREGCSNNKHKCRKLCHEDCEPCQVKVKKHRTVCSHVYEVLCNADVDILQCDKPCTRTLPCGHKCDKKCFEPCGPCVTTVDKIVPECGHNIKIKCYKVPTLEHCRGKCTRKLRCGHDCQNECREECTPTCHAMKDCNLPSLCGHIVKQIKCFERTIANDENLLKYCTQPCPQVLQCTHKCTGTCGQCFQGRIHARCAEKCGVPLVCNHECPIPCREACKPCREKCKYKCEHGRCKKKCGQVCVQCVEDCPRRCIHQKCRRKCGDLCDVKPCEMPCPKMLKCGHDCVGFCSEPCPKLCRICDKDELLEIFFGTEDEEGVRFVELQDCGHVMESGGMESWLENDNGEIQIKVCPKCKTSIINTQRYGEFVKKALLDINKVKLKLNGTPQENEELRMELLGRTLVSEVEAAKLLNHTRLSSAIRKCERRLQETMMDGIRGRVKQTFNAVTLKSITSKIQIFEHIIDICSRYESCQSTAIDSQIDFLLNPLLRDEEEITIQEIEDVQLEMSRLKRMVELFQISKKYSKKDTPKYFFVSSYRQTLEKLKTIEELVISRKRYTEVIDKEVETRLKQLKCGVPISDSERLEIVKAMGLSKGHWFKCPNGHPYVITECGGAMQEFDCPDCGERIGGTQHNLLGSNRLASEMDGAQFAAWSDVANNMGNYDMRRFQFN